MTNFLRKKSSDIKLKILKKRDKDFLRISGFRARKKEDKEKSANNSVSWVANGIVVAASPTRFDDSDKFLHVGFSATKKSISKLAVKRNKAKRILKALVNDNIRGSVPMGWDYIITARAGILDIPNLELEKNLKWALKMLSKKIDEQN